MFKHGEILRPLIVLTITSVIAVSLAACSSSSNSDSNLEWYQVTQLYANQDKFPTALENAGFTYAEDATNDNGEVVCYWSHSNVGDDVLDIAGTKVDFASGVVTENPTIHQSSTLSKQDLEDGKRGSVTLCLLVNLSSGNSSDELKTFADKVCDQCGLSNATTEMTYESTASTADQEKWQGFARAGQTNIDGEDVYWLVDLKRSDSGLTIVNLCTSGTNLSDFSILNIGQS